MSELRQKAIRGITYLGFGKSAGKLISFANTLVLARLLTPEDYGLMGMAMVVMGLIGFFNEIGLGSAIVQRKEINQNQLSSCFFTALSISLILYIGIYLGSDLAGEFYQQPLVGDILVWISLSLVLGAFSTVSYSLLRRELKFNIISMVEFATILVQCVITLLLAFYDFQVWALIYGFVVAHGFKSLAFIVFTQWKPSLEFSLSGSWELLKFGASVTYSRITWYIYTSIDSLIIGKILNERKLGIYSMAMSLATLPTSNITSLVTNVASPLFAKLQDNPKQLCQTLYKMTYGLAIISFPILCGLIITAPELIRIALGDQWLAAIPILQILAGLGFFKSIDPLLTQVLISTNNTAITARYTTLCALVVPSCIIAGAHYYDLEGAASGWLISYPILYFYLLFLIKKKLGVSIQEYVNHLVTPVSASLFMIFCIMSSTFAISYFVMLPISVLLVFKILIGFISYSFWLIYIRSESLVQLRIVLLDLGVSESKLNRWPFSRIQNHTLPLE